MGFVPRKLQRSACTLHVLHVGREESFINSISCRDGVVHLQVYLPISRTDR